MTSIDNLEDSSTGTVWLLLPFNNVTGPWACFLLCSGHWGEAERRELLCRDKGLHFAVQSQASCIILLFPEARKIE